MACSPIEGDRTDWVDQRSESSSAEWRARLCCELGLEISCRTATVHLMAPALYFYQVHAAVLWAVGCGLLELGPKSVSAYSCSSFLLMDGSCRPCLLHGPRRGSYGLHA